MSKGRTEPTTDFGRYLRKLMDAAGFETDADLGRVADVNASLLSKWQSGQTEPSVQSLRKVAPHLRVRLGDLMVKARLATPEELGMDGAAAPPQPAPRKLPPELARIVEILNDPKVPAGKKQHLLRSVSAAWDFWVSTSAIQPPREPSAAERARPRRRNPEGRRT